MLSKVKLEQKKSNMRGDYTSAMADFYFENKSKYIGISQVAMALGIEISRARQTKQLLMNHGFVFKCKRMVGKPERGYKLINIKDDCSINRTKDNRAKDSSKHVYSPSKEDKLINEVFS